jgi:hypothetical protein
MYKVGLMGLIIEIIMLPFPRLDTLIINSGLVKNFKVLCKVYGECTEVSISWLGLTTF